MASFGSFEGVREVYSDPIYSVYSARKEGDSAEYAVKVFQLPSGTADTLMGSQERSREEVLQECIERIKIQQQACANSSFIAPILETGQDDRGVWYVTRFYGRSVN